MTLKMTEQGKLKQLKLEETKVRKFKVTIKSTEWLNKSHRHFFEKVEENGPAQKMTIGDGDEIILVNGTFLACDISHREMVDIFKKAPVDGETRFSVILQRKTEESNSEQFAFTGYCDESRTEQWIDTNAVLIREGGRVVAKDVYHYPIRNKEITDTVRRFRVTVRRFRVTGTPGYYLTVEEQEVFAKELNGNALGSKIVIKQWMNEDDDFKCSLRSSDYNLFITINREGEVTTREGVACFSFSKIGSLICFKRNIKEPLFLAGGRTNEEIIARKEPFYFEEMTIEDSDAEYKYQGITVNQRQ